MRYKLSINVALLLILVIQAVIIGAIVLGVSIYNNGLAMNNIASQFEREILHHIFDHLNDYLINAEMVNKINNDLIQEGLLDTRNNVALMRHFLNQLPHFPDMTSIYFGNLDGGLAYVSREGDSLKTVTQSGFRAGNVIQYRITNTGEQLYRLDSSPYYDARERAWFSGIWQEHLAGNKVRDMQWSEVYSMSDLEIDDLCITLSLPVYSPQDELLGVLASDLYMSSLSEDLEDACFSPQSRIYILDFCGYLIASTDNLPYHRANADGGWDRLNFHQIPSSLTQSISAALSKYDLTDKNNLPNQRILFKHNDIEYYLFLVALDPVFGYDWLIMEIIPRDDVYLDVRQGNIRMAITVILLFLSALFISQYFSKIISHPIKKLSASAVRMAQGNLDERADTDTSFSEINNLAGNFNALSEQIQQKINELIIEVNIRSLAEKELCTEKSLLEVTFKSMGEGIILVNPGGDIRNINYVAELLTGYAESEAIGKPVDEIFKIADVKTRKVYKNPFADVLSKGETFSLNDPVLLLGKTDQTQRVIPVASPILSNTNEIMGLVVLFMNVTEKERLLEIAVNNQRLESLGNLAGGIAHEFNNVLQGIYGFIELAKMKAKDEKASYFLTQATASINKAKSLTQHLITFAKAGNPIKKLQKVEPFLRSVVSFALSGTSFPFELRIAPDLKNCYFDRNQIAQAIENIIHNAVQAMPQGRLSIDNTSGELGCIPAVVEGIVITAENHTINQSLLPAGVENNFIKISIKDFGVGIPPDKLNFIFDPFFSTKPQAQGLGLTTAYSIVMKHDGLLTCESEVGKYTEFHIVLPATDEEVTGDEEDTLVLNHGKGHLLLLEPDITLHNAYQNIFLSLGYSFVMTASGDQTIEEYQKSLYDDMQFTALILSSDTNTGLNGIETLVVIKQIDPYVTAFVTNKDPNAPEMLEPEKFGFADCLKKPFHTAELCEAFFKHCHRG